jgi:hypothetical protein
MFAVSPFEVVYKIKKNNRRGSRRLHGRCLPSFVGHDGLIPTVVAWRPPCATTFGGQI